MLGDGFYEQKLIREQVLALTGNRYLGDYQSDEQEYMALMNSGLTYAKQFNLRPGIALSNEQMAQLTSDMVWLVTQEVTLADGSKQSVLVPQVYVRVQPGDMDGSGALLAGRVSCPSVRNSFFAEFQLLFFQRSACRGWFLMELLHLLVLRCACTLCKT